MPPHLKGKVIGVLVTVYKDRTFNFELKSPPASVLLKDAVKAEKGSGEPNKNKIGKVTMAQCKAHRQGEGQGPERLRRRRTPRESSPGRRGRWGLRSKDEMTYAAIKTIAGEASRFSRSRFVNGDGEEVRVVRRHARTSSGWRTLYVSTELQVRRRRRLLKIIRSTCL